jgi:SAM-dependent methyltransferase
MSETTEIRARQREDWNLNAPGWKKWDSHLMKYLRPVGQRMLELAELEDGNVVLDVATGSGEPGLSAAKRVGKGRVIGIDISEQMVDIAREKAKRLGIDNYKARLYSSSKFPFDSDTFDAVISRFGLMFFPDVLGGLKEMARVLKPRGKLCVAVWGPQDERAQRISQILIETLDLPRPSPNVPGPFRCSEAGRITFLVREAGLHEVEQVEMKTHRVYRSVQEYWEYLLDTNPKIASAIANANQKARLDIRRRIGAVLDTAKNKRAEVSFYGTAWINRGVK